MLIRRAEPSRTEFKRSLTCPVQIRSQATHGLAGATTPRLRVLIRKPVLGNKNLSKTLGRAEPWSMTADDIHEALPAGDRWRWTRVSWRSADVGACYRVGSVGELAVDD